MRSNLGNTDKILRNLLAIVIAAIGIYFKSWWPLVANMLLVTGFISFIPTYKFCVNTCSPKTVQ